MFDKLLKAAIGTVLLPVEIAKDVVTLGGAMTDDTGTEDPYTVKRLKNIGKNIDEALK